MTTQTATSVRSPRFWIVPTVIVAIVMSILAAFYMGGIVHATDRFHHFPVALVNRDDGDVAPDHTTRINYGQQIADGLTSKTPPEQFDLRTLSIEQAKDELTKGRVYGIIVIPSDFTKRLEILGAGVAGVGDIERPIITINTSPRLGPFAAGILTNYSTTALRQANDMLGKQLTDAVTKQLGDATPVTAAAKLTLATPVNVVVSPNDPLPQGSGNGLSVFYYALLLLMAGFTGSVMLSSLLDGFLGVIPTEFGPRFTMFRRSRVNRLQTLGIKWITVVIASPVISALFLLITSLLGAPTGSKFALWLFGTFGIAAVGVVAMSILSIFGTPGLVVNLLFFVAFGLPSAGATVPLEATPGIMRFFSTFEPLRQLYLGVRAISYFDGQADAGLATAWFRVILGLVLGVVVGGLITYWYDRRGMKRAPQTENVSAS